jgi:hypothetical protein
MTSPPPSPVDLPHPGFPSRRSVVAGGVAGAAVALIGGIGAEAVALPLGADRARYLSPARLDTLRAVVDRIVPADDGTPGAVAARCHEAIDALLGAFDTDPPRIYAGGPFSDRGGSPVNHFARFLPLDAYERRAWRLRIHGSRGRRRLQRNGPVIGYQQVYARGLDALARSTPGFAVLPGPARDLVLRNASDPDVTAMLSLATAHTFETCFGAPEYGGNHLGVAWEVIGFDGDRQPRGYTRDEVRSPGTEPLPVLEVEQVVARFGPALAMATSEAMLGPLTATTTGHDAVIEHVQGLLASFDDAVAALTRDGGDR